MRADEGLVEARALVLPAGEIGARAEPRAIAQRILVLRPAPDREPDAGRRQLLDIPLEGQAEDVDRALARRAADVGVGRDGGAQAQAPPPARADQVEEVAHVGGHGLRRLAGQHPLEMVLREAVLPLKEEGAGKLQPHAHQLRPVEEDDAEGGDGERKQGLPPLFRDARLLGELGGREPQEEEHVGALGMAGIVLHQRVEDGERLLEAAGIHQPPRRRERGEREGRPLVGRGRSLARDLASGLLRGAPGGLGQEGGENEQQAGGNRGSAAEREEGHGSPCP